MLDKRSKLGKNSRVNLAKWASDREVVESFLHGLRGQNTKYSTRFSKAKGTKKLSAGPGMEAK